MNRNGWVFAATLLTATVAGADGTNPRDLGRQYQNWLLSGRAESLWPHFSPGMRELNGNALAGLQKFMDGLRATFGSEVRLTEELIQYPVGSFVYQRKAMMERGYLMCRWHFDREGVVDGMMCKGAPPDELGGEAPSKFLDYTTRTVLRLPFDGTWRVFWGGRTLKENTHANVPDQRFAYDFQAVRGRFSHEGDGKSNEQYYGFGQPVYAPAGGKVVEAVDGIEDNRPGDMPTDQPCGNHVMLDHGNGEFSALCHLKKGTVAVKSGTAVRAGTIIGRCGNSGHSSEPHLHYNLQNGPVLHAGDGLPAQFTRYVADGKPQARGEPTRGQVISLK